METLQKCPICQSKKLSKHGNGEDVWRCGLCLHCFRGEVSHLETYQTKANRNVHNELQEEKTQSRYRFINSYIPEKAHILDVGCAEGDLGALVRLKHPQIIYDGVEPSLDGERACKRLSHVFREPFENLSFDKTYDAVFFFHVIEHLRDPIRVLSQAFTASSNEACLVLEVPLESGSKILPFDHNPEHLHFFSMSSLVNAVERSGFRVLEIEMGVAESVAYNNCVRLIAKKSNSLIDRIRIYKNRLLEHLGHAFSIYAVGGTFHQLVLPYITGDQIEHLFDRDETKTGKLIHGRPVHHPDMLKQLNIAGQILITSIDYSEEIKVELTRNYGVDPERIVKLEDILRDV